MPRTAITSDRLAPAVGPFSPGVRAGELLFLSGQVAQDPVTGLLIEGDAAAQVDQICRNLAQLLLAADLTLEDVVRVGIFLVDMADFAAVNQAYARHFTRPYPVRTTVAVAALPLGARVEIEAVAHGATA